jgi:ABC-type bacteriocin/lantibiotic exporter with double-glycine peptidase domain
MKTWRLIKYLRPALSRIKRMLGAIALLTLCGSFIALLPPYLSKLLFDRGVIAGDVSKILYYGSLVLVVYLLAALLQFAGQALFSVTSNRFTVNVKNEALQRLLRMPLEFFDRQKSGYLVNRLNEVDTLGGLFSPTVFQFFSSLIQFAGAVGVMVAISGRITAAALLFLPLFYLITRLMSRRLKRTSQRLMETSAVMRGNLQEAVAGVPELKQFAAEGRKAQEIAKQFANVATQRVRQSLSLGMGMQSLSFLTNAASVLVLMLSGIYIARGQLSIGDYVALAGYALKLFVPVQLFGTFSLTLQPVLVALGRLSPIFETKTEQESWGSKRVETLEGAISFEDVSFAYDPEDGPVLKDCSLSIASGDCVAILGPNGSGKSTLVKLALGFYPDYSGQIMIDGTELRQYDVISLRKRIGIVSQNVILFTGSVWDNVKMAAPWASEATVEQALALSGCSKGVFGGKLRDVAVTEFGKNLSGGQRQAVAIARCLLKDPDVLIFDEATAHLDADTREVLMRALGEVFATRTRILITHDREIAGYADRVLLLQNGTVQERPTR